MTHKREALTIMDSATTTFGIQNKISISRTVGALIILFFIGCIVATGLLVYYLTSCSESSKSKIESISSPCNRTVSSISAATSTRTTYTPSTEKMFDETTTTAEPKTETPIDLRLPRSISPHSYNIKLTPFLNEDNFTFHGDVTILVNVTSEVDNITLHADELTIDKLSIHIKSYIGNEAAPVRDVSLDKKRQFLIIHLGKKLQKSQYIISIGFKGNLNDALQGFYRSSYQEGNQTR